MGLERQIPKDDFLLPHNLYNPAFSNTSSELNGTTFQRVYGSGFASGLVFADDISIGGVTIKDYPVELATNLSGTFFTSSHDSLIGMSSPTNNEISPP